jgi:hypothetical protein
MRIRKAGGRREKPLGRRRWMVIGGYGEEWAMV